MCVCMCVCVCVCVCVVCVCVYACVCVIMCHKGHVHCGGWFVDIFALLLHWVGGCDVFSTSCSSVGC